jgi:lysophospholipase L1-like esterase
MAANVIDAIMLFGDSITQGSWELNGIGARLSCIPFPRDLSSWGSQIWENLVVYARKLDVINRGLSGYNTEWAISVFEQVSWADYLIRVSKRRTE